MQLVLCHVAAVKCVPIHHHSAHYIFWSFGIIEFIFSHFENRVLHKPVLREIVGVAHFITGQLNRVWSFHFLDVFLASNEPNYSELIV